jgi:hypothetical protein
LRATLTFNGDRAQQCPKMMQIRPCEPWATNGQRLERPGVVHSPVQYTRTLFVTQNTCPIKLNSSLSQKAALNGIIGLYIQRSRQALDHQILGFAVRTELLIAPNLKVSIVHHLKHATGQPTLKNAGPRSTALSIKPVL